MKRITILALCLLALGTTVFAADYSLSVGFGGVFGIVNDKWDYPATSDYSAYYLDFNRMQYGGFAFFGNRFTEFSLSVKLSDNKFYNSSSDKNEVDKTMVLGVSAYGKIPIVFRYLTLFPTAGIDFDAVDTPIYFWLRGGVGADIFPGGERFFVRVQALYGYGIAPSFLFSMEEYDKVTPGHGPLFKLGMGWMF